MLAILVFLVSLVIMFFVQNLSLRDVITHQSEVIDSLQKKLTESQETLRKTIADYETALGHATVVIKDSITKIQEKNINERE